jgi:ribose 5-phosphate isomerase B
MIIALASDHAGYVYKEAIKSMLEETGHEVIDFGTDSTENVDYPQYVRPAAEAVARGEADRGIVLGGSGNGEAIVANKVPGVRCALVWDRKTAELARRHNNANCISIGERTVTRDLALEMVEVFLETPFDGGRHEARVRQIEPDRPQ